MMKSRPFPFLVTLLLLLPLALPLRGWAETGKPRPRISVEKTSYDFGQVFSGEKVTHIFKFRNRGDAPLVIERVRQSCGCTAAIVSSTVLEPGATGEVQSTFNSTGFSGEVVKTVYLYSNDPDSSVVQLYLRGTVQREIVSRPSRVSLEKMIPEKTVTASLQLFHQGKNAITFGAIQITTPELKAQLSADRIAPGETVTLSLSITPQAGKRRFGGFIIIPMNGAHMKELRIPVYASVVVPPRSPASQP
jgi:hypothetical protein